MERIFVQTQAQRAILESVRRFVETEVVPRAAALDSNNGMKHFISNGNRASHYLVFVQTDKDKPLAKGSTCFLVERDRPGFTIGLVHDKMGERLANNAELIFQDCFS